MPTRPTRTARFAASLRQLDAGLAALRDGLVAARRVEAHGRRRRHRVRPRGRGQRHARHRPRHRRRRLRARRRGQGRPRRRRLARAREERDRFEGRDLRTTTDLRAVLKGVLGDHLQVARSALDSDVFPDSAARQAAGAAGLTRARRLARSPSRVEQRRRCRRPCARRRRGAAPRSASARLGHRALTRPVEQRERLGDAGLDVGDAQRRAGRERELGGLREVEGVRAHHDRAAAGRRLDQVLAAERREAAAEQRDVGERVLRRHLAHRVAEPRRRRRARRPAARRARRCAARSVKPAPRDQAGDLVEALRMARHDDEQRPRRRPRRARRRAAPPPRLRASTPRARRGRPERLRARRGRARAAAGRAPMSNFRLPLTPTSRAPAVAQARRVGVGLREDAARGSANAGPQQRVDARAAAPAALAQARVGEHHRHAARLAPRRAGSARSRSPSARRRAGAEVAQEAAHRAGRVERQPGLRGRRRAAARGRRRGRSRCRASAAAAGRAALRAAHRPAAPRRASRRARPRGPRARRPTARPR